MSTAAASLDRPQAAGPFMPVLPRLARCVEIDPHQLEQYRLPLTRLATRLLRDADAAQDAVQETLLAALQPGHGFGDRSSLKTWLFAILKHKVIDIYRRQAREQPLLDDGDDDDASRRLFTEDGRWREPPAHWGDPEAALDERRFAETLERCIDALPKNQARVFTLRELMGLETAEICRTLGITPNYCMVILHRARLALRASLQQRWLGLARA